MGRFDDELNRQRELKNVADADARRAAADKAAHRDRVRQDASTKAHALLPELLAATRALQGIAARADKDAYRRFPNVHVDTKVNMLRQTKITGWRVHGYISIPRHGRPSAGRPQGSTAKAKRLSLEAFASEGHWWWTTTDRSSGRTDQHNADAGNIFEKTIETIAAYVASFE